MEQIIICGNRLESMGTDCNQWEHNLTDDELPLP